MVIPFSTANTAGIAFNQVWTQPLAGAPNFGYELPPLNLGTIVYGADGSAWIFVKVGTGGITTGGFVACYDEDFLAVMFANAVGAQGDKLGVFGGTASALVNDYCWLQVYGTCDQIQVAASDAANAPQASTTTAGVIDDAVATPTKNILGLVLTTARAASQGIAPGELNWPTVGTTN